MKQRKYSVAYKGELVARMMKPGGPMAKTLAAETGIPNQTLSKWLQEAHKLPLMANEGKGPTTEWSVADKARIVAKASELSGTKRGEYLRTEGVHPDQLAMWEKALEDGYDQDKATKRYIGKLEREIRRKDKALAEAAALAILKKKADLIWGVADDDTDDGFGR
jgi:transposase